MNEPPLSDEALDTTLAVLAEQITARLQEGETLAVDAILERNPAQAGALRAMLPTLSRLAELARAVDPKRNRRRLIDPDPRTTSGL